NDEEDSETPRKGITMVSSDSGELLEPVVMDHLQDVVDFFQSQITNLNQDEWKIYRFDEEDEDYPDAFIFCAVDNKTGESIDLPYAILPKDSLTEEEEMEIMAIDLIVEPDDEDEEDETLETSAEDGDDNSEEENEVKPTSTLPAPYTGYTVH
ncbi:MAG: hypothetical protein HY226_01765, partial [Candidatus Vogelbacteria bacterium]|nr:hypothetical protein [Candidatus Vogelbacteria bacterium]